MHLDKHLYTVFDQVQAGVNVSFLLHLRVENATGPQEYAIRTLVKRRVCDVPYTIDLSPWFPVPFEVRWLMPNASPTCNTFYIVGVDRTLNGRIIASHAERMLKTVETDIKRDHPGAWRLTYFVSQLFT